MSFAKIDSSIRVWTARGVPISAAALQRQPITIAK